MQQRIMAMGCFMGQTPHMQVHTPDYVVPLASVCCQEHQVQLCPAVCRHTCIIDAVRCSLY